MPNVKIYAPQYYNDFKCIAGKCRHSCCIDWEIYIDDKTLEKYKKCPDIMSTITKGEDGACFELSSGGRCPHLNSDGLCDIIIAHGKDYLSEICSCHPRFYNHVYTGEIEAGLGIVCEEVCRIVLENDKGFSLVLVEETEDEGEDNEFEQEYNPLPVRDKIAEDIQARGSFNDKVLYLKRAHGIWDFYTIDQWIDRLLTLEILDKSWEVTLKQAKSKVTFCKNPCYDKYYDRLLTYFVYRHVSVADSDSDLASRLGFAILSVEIIKHLFETEKEQSFAQLLDLSRRYSAEIEYSRDNTYELIFEFGMRIN